VLFLLLLRSLLLLLLVLMLLTSLLLLLLLQLQDLKKNEDPRLSFCTPEFKDAQRTFTDAFKVGGGTCNSHFGGVHVLDAIYTVR
jgi:hypothetical protein